MLDREFWVEMENTLYGGREGGKLKRMQIDEISSTTSSTQIPNHKTTQKKDLRKEHRKQAKTGCLSHRGS